MSLSKSKCWYSNNRLHVFKVLTVSLLSEILHRGTGESATRVFQYEPDIFSDRVLSSGNEQVAINVEAAI
jgi:hypothetical protein